MPGEIIRMSGDDVDGLPPVGASPVVDKNPPAEPKKEEPKAAPAAPAEKKEEPKAPVAAKPAEEPKAPSKEPAEQFLGGMTDAEVDQTLAELAQTATQAESMRRLTTPLSKAQLDYVAEAAKKLGKTATSEAKTGEKKDEPAKPAASQKEAPKTPVAAGSPKVDPLLAGLSPEVRAHVEKMQAERDAAVKKAEAEARKAETIMQEKRAETVKRQRAELFSTARAQGVPEDVLEDVWANAVAIRRSDKALTHASVGDIITAVRQKKPSLFREAPAKPDVKPPKPEKKQDEVRMTPRANPPHSGQNPPALPKAVTQQSFEGVNSLNDAAEKMRQRGREMFGGN